jgi:hypothetical protein
MRGPGIGMIAFTLWLCVRLHNWSYTLIVLCTARESFSQKETSPLPVTFWKIKVCMLGALGQGSLSCHNCCHTGLRVFGSHPNECPIKSPPTRGTLGDLFFPGSSRVPIQSPLTTRKGCWEHVCILTRILTGPYLVPLTTGKDMLRT